MKKVMFISSIGGHFTELMQFKGLFKKYDYHIVTEEVEINEGLKDKYGDKVDYLVYGTRKNLISYLFKFTYNIFKSLYIFIKVKPKVIVTTGTHTAVPMCYIAKLFGAKVIYIETYANRTTKTVAGRIIYPIADTFVVQWKELLELYPKAEYWGGVF
ncbi:MAG: PssD/Cps14F family polysaccharide biosynthesis glycosyltransferase [Clostridia bacterium]|nr:PssD/Cps14F family polysaccharide biosynthesis glycosyltransferase [Clostridia bacterium]